MLKSAHFPS